MPGIGINLRVGNRQGGNSYKNYVPAGLVTNLVRAWSTRRELAAYKTGKAIRSLTSNGGTETDNNLLKNGSISLSGVTAYANTIYEQIAGLDASKVLQAVFANCPKIHDGTTGTQIAPSFDGGDYLAMGSADSGLESLLTSSEWSYTVWAKCLQTGSNPKVIFHRQSIGAGYLVCSFTNGKIQSYNKSLSPINSTGNFNDGNWHFIAVTCKGTTNGHKLYVDAGTPDAANVGTVAGGTSLVSIGAKADGTLQITGSINDLVFWNKELSAAEITSIYNTQKVYYGL